MIRAAALSRDRRYRYRLARRWAPGPELPWIMLNPSAADDTVDDPTIRRVVAFSRSWGYAACTVVNLFGFRCADPWDLLAVDDPAGPGNVRAVRTAIEQATAAGSDAIVVGWGVRGHVALRADSIAGSRARRAVAVAASEWAKGGAQPVCLGLTADGAPRHPLYVSGSTRPQPVPAAVLTAWSETRRPRAGAARR